MQTLSYKGCKTTTMKLVTSFTAAFSTKMHTEWMGQLITHWLYLFVIYVIKLYTFIIHAGVQIYASYIGKNFIILHFHGC